jgi:hypothetical protein
MTDVHLALIVSALVLTAPAWRVIALMGFLIAMSWLRRKG